MKKGNQKKIEKLAKQALQVMEQLEEMKPLYNELDFITCCLVEAGAQVIEIDDKKVIVIDNFAVKNTVFKTTSVKRFELKVA